MALPVPNLDDRRFQDLVDDAKRLVQQRCPEWTDHNVSDPGVTLIELFAWMSDQLLYRMNRVPDRHYVKFLELLGVRLFPPIAARAGVTFWLSAPQSDVVRIAAATQVATVRTQADEAIVFGTLEDLAIVPCALARPGSIVDGKQFRDGSGAIDKGTGFLCFDTPPKPGDALMVGLTDAVPACAITLRIKATIEGVGVDPDRPPLVWEAWDGAGWSECEVDRDGTGGLNRDGDIVLHVPASHTASVIDKQRAGWIRARIVEPEDDQPAYSASPSIRALGAFTIGGTTTAVNAEVVHDELVGVSGGIPGQRFLLKRRPIVPGSGPAILQVSDDEGWLDWQQVATFADSGPADHHFVLDAAAGEGGVAADPRIGVVDRRHALAMGVVVAQAAFADVAGLDHQMRRHRKIAEQAFALGDARMARGDDVAESPHRDVAETFGRRKQLPVFQLVAEHRIGDIVGGEREAIDLDQQGVVRQLAGVGQFPLDESALLQIVACNGEIGGFHFFDPGIFAAAIFAFADDRFATGSLFKTVFAFGSLAITPSRLRSTR